MVASMKNKVYLDFETYYDSTLSLSKITTVQYVHHPDFKIWGVGVKLNNEPTEWFGEDEYLDALQNIPWEESSVICHNTLFDAYILTQYLGLYPAYYYDTAAMARGLYPNQSASLKATAERVFPNDNTMRKGDELVNAKGIRDLPPDIEEQIAGYCIQDVDLTYAIFQKFIQSYPQDELNVIDLTCRMYVEPKLTLNRELLITHKETIKTNTEQLIEQSGVDRETLASQKKFAEYLESLDIVVPTKTSPSTGKKIPAFSKTDSAYIQMQKVYPEYQHLWDAREAVKSRIEETRAQRMLENINPDNTFSVPLRYYAAHTGRFGGTESINLQNLPRGSVLRNAIQAPNGQLLYVADLSNIEARMLAWLAKEVDLLHAFAAGEDVYSNFASQIYGRPITKANKLERYVGKTAILGLGYGMGHEKFKYTLKTGSPSVEVTDSTALAIVSQYRAMYPNIPKLWNAFKQHLFTMINTSEENRIPYGPLVIKNKAIQLPNTMHLHYPELVYQGGQHMYNSGKGLIKTYGARVTENVVQALARIVIIEQMLAVHKLPEVSVVLQVHDEIIGIGSNVNPDETLNKIIGIMKTPPYWCSDLPLDAEGSYSQQYDK
jgi:DNA polymerase